MLGLGAMGRALAGTALDAGHELTLWNRTPGKARDLLARGAREASGLEEAVRASDVIVVCLYDAASVRATLHGPGLAGKTVINLTSTTPGEAVLLAQWARDHRVAYLDGAIMTAPPMVGGPDAVILYSGDEETFGAHRGLLDTWATSTFLGTDVRLASLVDLALLSGMYAMFAGFLHGVAMVQSAGMTAAEYAGMAAPFLASMTRLLGHSTDHLEARDYGEPLQSLDWTATLLDTIARASREQGVEPAPVAMVQRLVTEQIRDGHGGEDFDRIIETMR